jgi:hypothetical protein
VWTTGTLTRLNPHEVLEVADAEAVEDAELEPAFESEEDSDCLESDLSLVLDSDLPFEPGLSELLVRLSVR